MFEMRLVSQSILAPEVLLRDWRTCYNLPLLGGGPQSYDELNATRLRRLAEHLSALKPDVVCLQDLSPWVLPGEEATFDVYLARRLGFNLVNTVFSEQSYDYNYPPAEVQPVRRSALGSALLVHPEIEPIMPHIGAEPPSVTALLDGPGFRPVIASTLTYPRPPEDRLATYLAAQQGVDLHHAVITGSFHLEQRSEILQQMPYDRDLILHSPLTGTTQVLTGLRVHGHVRMLEMPHLLRHPATYEHSSANWLNLISGAATTAEPTWICELE